VEKGLPIKDRCWRRAPKEKEMWRPSKSEDTDRFFFDISCSILIVEFVFVETKKKEKKFTEYCRSNGIVNDNNNEHPSKQ
jgi:hypothetical protein